MKGLFQCPPWAKSFCPFRACKRKTCKAQSKTEKGSQGKNKLARLPLFHLYKQEPLYQGSALKLILSAKSTFFMPFSPLIRFRY